jgi:hypothetical protein
VISLLQQPARTALLTLLALLVPGASAAQTAPDRTTAGAARGPLFTVHAGINGLHESNANRRSDALATSAVAAEAILQLSSRPVRPLLRLEYASGYRTSAENTRFDGVTHRGLLTVDIPLSSRVSTDVVGRLRRGGVDEDLERANEVMVLGRVGADLNRRTRVRAYGGQRWRDLGPAGPAPGFYVGGEVRRRFSRTTSLTADVRHEELSPDDATRSWNRDAISLDLAHRVGRITLEVEGRRRWRTYPHRWVDDSDQGLGVREDRDWQLGTVLVFDHSATTQLRFGYQLDRRNSTSADRTFTGHRLNVTARQRLLGWSVPGPVQP